MRIEQEQSLSPKKNGIAAPYILADGKENSEAENDSLSAFEA